MNFAGLPGRFGNVSTQHERFAPFIIPLVGAAVPLFAQLFNGNNGDEAADELQRQREAAAREAAEQRRLLINVVIGAGLFVSLLLIIYLAR